MYPAAGPTADFISGLLVGPSSILVLFITVEAELPVSNVISVGGNLRSGLEKQLRG